MSQDTPENVDLDESETVDNSVPDDLPAAYDGPPDPASLDGQGEDPEATVPDEDQP